MAKRFYAEYFGFLFDNTLLCYLCVFISLPFFFYLLITAVFVIKYGLKYVTNLVIAYISFSTYILFDYKLVLVIFELGV